jgi:hypothetical protein
VRDLAVLFVHLLATVARLAGPGGVRAVLAESLLVKQQLLILNRSRKRSPSLRLADRVVAGVCTLLMRPSRLVRVAIVLDTAKERPTDYRGSSRPYQARIANAAGTPVPIRNEPS